MTIRKAKVGDIERIKELIDKWAQKELMLARSLNELYENARDFWVCEENGQVVGCAALHVDWADLGEIRSLAVEEKTHRRGIGTKLVEACLSEARELGLKKVFTLTYRQDFFEKNGFTVIDKSLLPHKIWNECIRCPKFPNCDEIAMMRELG
jgi:amino-acid N-acetyltransferase